MREYKFRAWDTFNERMVDAPYLFQPSTDYDKVEGDERFNAPFTYYEDWRDAEDGIRRPCHIMQYTGLKDKNGKEICEGDILRKSYSRDTSGKDIIEFTESVEYETDGGKSGFDITFLESCEIIGNIYEHPHLLSITPNPQDNKK